MRLSPVLLALLLGGCQWIAGYDTAASPELEDGSSPQDKRVKPDAGRYDAVDEAGRIDAGPDGRRMDIAPPDRLVADAPVDGGRADAPLDMRPPDATVDIRPPDATLVDGAADAAPGDTRADTTSPDAGIAWVVHPVESSSGGTFSPRAVAIDTSGRIAVGGSFTGSIRLPPQTTGQRISCPVSDRCPLLLLGSHTGGFDYTFDRVPLSGTDAQVEDVAFDSAGRLLAGGYFAGSLVALSSAVDVDTTALSGRDGFVVRWNASAAVISARKIQGDGDDEVLSVAAHPSEPGIYAVGGRFTSTSIGAEDAETGVEEIPAKLATGLLGSNGFVMVFKDAFATADVVPAAVVVGGDGEDAIYDVLLTETGLIAAGAFSDTITSGCPTWSPLKSNGLSDGIVAHYSTSLSGLVVGHCSAFGGPGDDEARRLLWRGGGGDPVHVIGSVRGSGFFDGLSYSARAEGDFFRGLILDTGAVDLPLAWGDPLSELAHGAALFGNQPLVAGTVGSQGTLLGFYVSPQSLANFATPTASRPSMDVASDGKIIVLVSESEAGGLLPDGKAANASTIAFIAIGTP